MFVVSFDLMFILYSALVDCRFCTSFMILFLAMRVVVYSKECNLFESFRKFIGAERIDMTAQVLATTTLREIPSSEWIKCALITQSASDDNDRHDDNVDVDVDDT